MGSEVAEDRGQGPDRALESRIGLLPGGHGGLGFRVIVPLSR